MGYFLLASGASCTWFAPASDHRLVRALNRPRRAKQKTPRPEKIRAGIAVSIRTAALLRRRFF
jgi:hypothetical protein